MAKMFPAYWAWIREEAAEIHSDGCSKVPDIYLPACHQHDLGYFYGRDPKVAFWEGWDAAPKVSRGVIDQQFRATMQELSPVHSWSPISWWRWAGVRVGGGGAWNEHRQKRP